jgi:hypothetical protein
VIPYLCQQLPVFGQRTIPQESQDVAEQPPASPSEVGFCITITIHLTWGWMNTCIAIIIIISIILPVAIKVKEVSFRIGQHWKIDRLIDSMLE